MVILIITIFLILMQVSNIFHIIQFPISQFHFSEKENNN